MKNTSLRTSVRLTLAAIAVSIIPFSAIAEEQLESLTVTANRMPSVNVLAPTTVITRADIDRLQINDLPNLLSRQPGIDMSVSGGIGKASSIHMRGTNSDHVLVLIDGIKWHSATLGGASIQDFPVEQIERIEIVRGSRSGLYGSEAIGGVIQIFTRQGKQGFTPYAKASYGSHDSQQFAAGIRGSNNATTYSLGFNHQSTDGIHILENQNPDKDGYRNNSISAKIQHDLSDDLSIGANFLQSKGINEYDGQYSSITDKQKSDFKHQLFGLNAEIAVTESWNITLTAGESKDEFQDHKNGLDNGEFNTRHRSASIINTLALSEINTVNIGIDYDEDKVDGSTAYEATSRDNKAIFVSWQAQYDKSSWLISVRHDDNESFGNKNTGSAEWGYQLQPSLQFVINAGTAFKAPTFNDLYYPFVGNTELQPEESKFWGLGLNGQSELFDWNINLYQTKIDDLIAWAPISPGSWTWNPQNVNEAKIKGIEFDISTNLMGAEISANASFLKPEDEATGKILARRAQRLANINIDKQWGAWSTGANWKLRGHSFDDASNSTRLGGYGLLDINIAYRLNNDWSIQANVKNIFDKEYQTVNNYNSLDRTGMVTLSYTP